MDCYDKILEEHASKYMARFNLIEFKINFPSLYTTIRESLKFAYSKSTNPIEVETFDRAY